MVHFMAVAVQDLVVGPIGLPYLLIIDSHNPGTIQDRNIE